MYQSKKIFIFGMARSGFAAAKVLAKMQSNVTIVDAKEQDSDKIEILEKLGVKFIQTTSPELILDETYDYVVKNPGISYNHPCILKANKLNIRVINEVEVAYNLLPHNVKIVGITGSNGKTTTTTLVYEILKKAGLSVHLGGNIGIPFCDLLSSIKENDILVIELSAQQLHDFDHFKTDISVLTNLYEVHLDFFGDYETYKLNKKRIFNHHNSSNTAILNKDNMDVMTLTTDIKSSKEYFSSQSSNADIYMENDFIYYQGKATFNTKNILLKGNHNYENIMTAILVAKKFSIDNSIIKEVLSNFKGVEHRIEFVSNIKDRFFYNDSKSTNVTSTITALKSFKTPVILLLGGLDRGHSFDELTSYLTNVKTIVCYGETKERIKDFADKNKVNCYICNNLEEAIYKAYEKSLVGDTILLSPASASWDQYKDFEARGNNFKDVVKKIEKDDINE
ncbi:MAG: UDP-N-acetylmuramoyl-L-alanine--D-glutamate ligase [Bacilli bacterium]|nr:UDP-N-acetylmuramoyl-L-alanine--D-glutamate ligase [Bacilli bacterium]